MRPFPTQPALLALLLVLLSGLACGCSSAAAGGAEPDATDGVGGVDDDVIARPSHVPRAPLLVAFDDRHALVVVRADDGALVARRELGGGVASDVLVDERRGRILVLLEEEESDARLIAVPWTGEELGAPEAVGGTAGRARMALHHAGVLVASDADGPRVRLLRDDREPTRGRALSPPRSWWSDGDLGLVHGLELPPGGEATRFVLGMDGTGSASVIERRALGLTAEEARLVRTGPDQEHLVGLDPSGTVRAFVVPAAGPVDGVGIVLATGIARLEGAVGWPLAAPDPTPPCGGEPARGIAVVTAEPPSVVVASIEQGVRVTVALDAEPPSGSPYGRRDLAIAGGRMLVATHGGVVALGAPADGAGGGGAGGGAGLRIERDPGFQGGGLRGPLACLVR